MSSVVAVQASPLRAARFFVSTGAASDVYNADGSSAGTALAAGVLVRDMGKTVRTPAASTVGSVSTQLILRKVARVTGASTGLVEGMAPASGFVGFSESAESLTSSYYSFYINVLGGEWVSVSL
jgi:hypothetical protein